MQAGRPRDLASFIVLLALLVVAACGDSATAPDAGSLDVPDAGSLDVPDAGTSSDSETNCTDGLDNDGDGRADCMDTDCNLAGECPSLGTFVTVAAGTFTMGSPSDEIGRDFDETQREVTLTRSFLIGVNEVTQAAFAARMGYNPSYFALFEPCDDCPVETVSWHEALAYANAASIAEGLPACFTCSGLEAEVICDLDPLYATPYDCEGYRLPTEAEWELAARAGESASFSNGGNLVAGTEYACLTPTLLDNGEQLDSVAWFCGNSGDSASTHPVGQLLPNAIGLYDMSGNVSEWTWDRYDSGHDSEAVTDPVGAADGPRRIARGGYFGEHPAGTRFAARSDEPPTARGESIGTRLARSLP